MVRGLNSEYLILNYIFRRGTFKKEITTYKNVKLLTDIYMAEKLKLINKHICPYCGRHFMTKSALIRHLTSGWKRRECKNTFLLEVKHITDKYVRLQNCIERKEKYILRIRNDQLKFKTPDLLRTYIREHPEILEMI